MPPHKIFAEGYPKNSDGWIIFPRVDKLLREPHFLPETLNHPARANLHLVQEIIRYVSEPGDIIMDVMAGTGAILLGALESRLVTALDLNPLYCQWMRDSAAIMGLGSSQYNIIEGDCRKLLPLSCNHIIFSPPYADMIHKATPNTGQPGWRPEDLEAFQVDPRANLGNMSEFLWNQTMKKVYELCLQSLHTGGTMTLIIKDTVKNKQIQPLGLRAISSSRGVGFELQEWFQWAAPGGRWKEANRHMGYTVVEGEHIIIMRRP